MSDYKIQAGIAMPTSARFRWSHKYPFRDMNVGDSFEFEEVDFQRIRSASSQHRRNNGRKARFVVRRTENGKGRCWRVE